MRAEQQPDDLTEHDQALLRRIDSLVVSPPPAHGTDDGVDSSDSFEHLLAALSQAAPRPNPAFQQRLERELVTHLGLTGLTGLTGAARAPLGRQTEAGGAQGVLPLLRRIVRGVRGVLPRPVRVSRRVALAAAVLGSIALAVPVYAQLRLPHIAPQETREAPAFPIQRPPGVAPPFRNPPEPRLMDQAHIERQVGFTLLTPAYLPHGCGTLLERYILGPGLANDVWLRYPCVTIAQQTLRGVARPYVGEGAVEEVLVGGRPALYIDGVWGAAMGEPTSWQRGRSAAVWLERNGLFVRISTSPFGSVPLARPKEELIRIAESLR